MVKDFFIALWFSAKQITAGNKKSFVMTIMVISLLFINIIFINAMMRGVKQTTENQIIDYNCSNIIIKPTKKSDTDTFIKNAQEKIDTITTIPGIVGAVKHYRLGARISYDADTDGTEVKSGNWTIRSVDPLREHTVLNFKDHMVAGRYLMPDDHDKIILGREISGGFDATFEMNSLRGAAVGDDVYVTFPHGAVKKYEVVGIFVTKNFVADAQAFITNDEMEDVITQYNLADEILVKTQTKGDESVYIKRIKRAIGQKFDYYSWEEYTGAITTTTESLDVIKYIFYVIGLAVSGASIFIIIYINLIHQKRQIGIIRSIGMKNSIIITTYVLQAIFYGLMGVIIGALVSKYIIHPIFIARPFDMPMGFVSLDITNYELWRTSISMVVIAFIAGLLPSMQISKKDILHLIFK